MAISSLPASISVKLIKLNNTMESLEKSILEPPDLKVFLGDYGGFLLRHHALMKDEIAFFVKSVEELSRGIPTVFRPGMPGNMADVVQKFEEGLKEAMCKFMLYRSRLEKCRRIEYRLELVKDTLDDVSRDIQKMLSTPTTNSHNPSSSPPTTNINNPPSSSPSPTTNPNQLLANNHPLTPSPATSASHSPSPPKNKWCACFK